MPPDRSFSMPIVWRPHASAAPPVITPATISLPEQEPNEDRPHITTPHLSFSQLSMYMRCSKQYYFRYIIGLKDPPKLANSIGKGGHSALETNTRHKIKHGTDMTLEALLDFGSTFIDTEVNKIAMSDYKDGDDKGHTKDRALAAITVYRVRDAENLHPIGAETEFNLDLNPTEALPYPIRIVNGKIDWIGQDHTTTIVDPRQAAVHVEDYKFSGTARSQGEVDTTAQLTVYAKALHTITGAYPTKLGYRMFLFGGKTDRSPADSRIITRNPALVTPDALDARFNRLVDQFSMAERGIAAGVYGAVDDWKACSWCGFQERCQKSLIVDFDPSTVSTSTSAEAA